MNVVRSVRTAATLGLVGAALPANAAITGAALVWGTIRRDFRPVPTEPRTVLISGGKRTKALHLARCFHRAGHRVVLIEAPKYRWTGHRFSNAVDAFYTVPSPGSPGYAEALADIAAREGVDVFVPVSSPASSLAEAEVAEFLPTDCLVVHGDAGTVRRLDDKVEFARMTAEAGLAAPDSYRVTDPEQVPKLLEGTDGRYILKSIVYDPINRQDLTPLPRPTEEATLAFARSKPMSESTPWVLQELLEGVEYCSHSTLRDGTVMLQVTCKSSGFQVNYDSVDRPAIDEWVRRFSAAHRLNGQVSIDFIVGSDDNVRAIECNPRTHSAITVFDDPIAVACAYLEVVSGDDGGDGPVRPLPGARPTYWAYQELWRLMSHPTTVTERLRVVLRGRDAIFDWDDPLPFLLVHHLQIPSLLIRALIDGRDWMRIDFNIGKLVEPAGD
jgi:hypothetical protein